MTELPSARAIALKENARRGDWTDGVEFEALPAPTEPVDGKPYATHKGTIELAGTTLTVYQLSDGQRVIDARDVMRLLEPEPNAFELGAAARRLGIA